MVLTLYGVILSPPYRAVLMTAKLLGLEINEKVVDLKKGDHLTPEFMKLNPQHTVPTLTDDDFVVWDSHAIVTYLINTYGKDDSLYPKDPKKRAIVDQRLHFDSGIIFPRMRGIFYPILMQGQKEVDQDKAKELLEAYEFLEKFLERSTWLAGEQMTIADVCIAAAISSCNVLVPVTQDKFPKLKAWFEKMKGLPFYKENEPGLETLSDLFKTLMG